MISWYRLRTCRPLPRDRTLLFRSHGTKHGDVNNEAFHQLQFPDIEIGKENGVLPETTPEKPQHEECGPDEPDLTPDEVRPPFAKAFTKVPGDARTHRARGHGNRPLPLSPVIDPVFVATRNRWKMKKAPPPTPTELTPFQKALQNNPYGTDSSLHTIANLTSDLTIPARALATPVRHSQTSLARVPNFFLLPLDLRSSPQPPHTLTFVPSKLWAQTSATAPGNPGIRGTQSYIDMLQATIDYVSKPSKISSMLNPTHHAQLSHEKRDITMRQNMSDFVLGLLRQALLKSLVWSFKNDKAGIIEQCDKGAHYIGKIENVACVIYIDSIYPPYFTSLTSQVAREIQEAERLGKNARALQIQRSGPALVNNQHPPNSTRPSPMLNPNAVYTAYDYALAMYKDRKVPVYSLAELLGKEKTAELVRGTRFGGARCVVLKEGERSVKAQMWLLRLRYFLSIEFDTRPHGIKEGAK